MDTRGKPLALVTFLNILQNFLLHSRPLVALCKGSVRQDIVFEERYYEVHPTKAYSDLMGTDHVFGNFAQMLDEDNSRELSCRGGGKCGQ